jgi:hypothetical protein
LTFLKIIIGENSWQNPGLENSIRGTDCKELARGEKSR